ncbi:hypothetical protein JCM14244_11480 [Venenivibrio stagnispumantis]|uniref:Glycosyltransferase 2-like domain-containing protein n=1 Tax=Venenivibrio stagnispumantis TaxID=407998 RepID=A0AA46AF73_9AQUI|nr:glycosyltransferase family 2 protein [Venenivibrio stagnispumantis]MCW4573211.1 glycosyltransferase family 2 protein [Venenivibrio stagnispumantis]SMP17308.1 hypothetical protein SAMN06264868_1168 [Venenivibrio stagnispumantis]
MISFILVNYNTLNLTYESIKSIIESFDDKNEYEIILVDNNSKDGSKEFFLNLEKKLNNFKYIYLEENLGFAKANNTGFKYSKGEYIYILNPDTLLHTKNINQIIDNKFAKDEKIAVIATKVIYGDGSLQPNVQKFTNLFTVSLRLLEIGKIVRNNKFLLNIFKYLPFKPKVINVYLQNFNEERKESFIDWASGCSLIFRRDIFEKLGGFDEKIFMYTEDEEICYRVHKLGYKILYTPDIVITHFVGKSSKNINDFIVKTKVKSEFYYFKKHFPKKINRLKFIYNIVSFLGYPFSKRLRIIRKTLKEITE